MEGWQLDLSRHCILTEIRRQQERAVSEALKGHGDESLLDKAESLKRILEGVDLKSLRARYPELQGGFAEAVWLFRREGRYCLCFSGRTVTLISGSSF